MTYIHTIFKKKKKTINKYSNNLFIILNFISIEFIEINHALIFNNRGFTIRKRLSQQLTIHHINMCHSPRF